MFDIYNALSLSLPYIFAYRLLDGDCWIKTKIPARPFMVVIILSVFLLMMATSSM